MWAIQRWINEVGEFILSSFQVVFRDIYEIVACSCADILHFNEKDFAIAGESRATSEKCIDQNEPGCRDIAYPAVRIDSVRSADKSCQPNSTL